VATAAILTIGNELVSGDVPNTNGSWLAKRLASLGAETRLLAAVPDEIEPIAELIRREAPLVDFFIVTGGLGGTPDDLTREALAYTFNVLSAIRSTQFAGRRFRAARARSRIRSAEHPALRSRTSMCCPAFRPRWRRCSIRSPRSFVVAARSARGAARTARERA